MTALSAYRSLLRATGIAFRGTYHKNLANLGDIPVLSAARQEVRRNFDQARELTDEEARTKLQHAAEVSKVLRQNVVQGAKRKDSPDTYDLRIHKDIELGDNETIRNAKRITS